MKPSILFVDDEPNILNGLKRMLHSMQDHWDMTFCLTGQQALKELENKHPDIVVTDLLMPQMDGVQLLKEVHARHPEIIRIVLSGHSDKNLALKATLYAHQFLPKPYEAKELQKALKRIFSLRSILTNPEVQAVLSKMGTLPSLPKVHQLIMRELQKENPSVNRVAELIAQDIGLTASIMKLVNSAFFGLRTRVSSPHHAVNLLGLDVISALALSVHFFSSFDSSHYPGFDLDLLWKHSLATGLLSKTVGKIEGLSTQEQDGLYISGILHDIGKLALLSHGQTLYKDVISKCQEDNVSIWRMEQAILGTSHAEVGGYLLSLWGLDEEIIQSVCYHHDLENYVGDWPLTSAMVHAANCFEHELNEINPGYDHNPMDIEVLKKLGLADRLPAWREACEKVLKEVREHGHEDTDS